MHGLESPPSSQWIRIHEYPATWIFVRFLRLRLRFAHHNVHEAEGQATSEKGIQQRTEFKEKYGRM